jgi:signal transduction histidine kinase
MKRPSGLTLLTCALFVLLPALAVLQYRWIGQVSVAAHERMRQNLRNAAQQFRDTLEGEVARALLSLQAGPLTARDGSSERYSDRYDTWINTTLHAGIVANIYLVDTDGDQLRLRHWNGSTHTFDSASWPPVLEEFRPQFEHELVEFTARPQQPRRVVLGDEDSLVVAPLRTIVPGARAQPTPPMFGFTVLELDMSYIRERLLPDLAQRHFTHPGAETYRVAVTTDDNPAEVLFRSDPDATVDATRADATIALLGGPAFSFGRADALTRGPRRGGLGNPLGDVVVRSEDAGRPIVEDAGRWRLVVQHQQGSLEAAVARVRHRNLAISFGVLLLLTVSVGVMSGTSRRAHRLAQQQMEFVAGVTHELRTPVAVIRSAGENLSHGVVGSADRVKRYGEMIESEARRLGDMVERVLQYAGIESGLGIASRTPLRPVEIIDSAVASALPLVGPDKVDVHRDIAPDLPTVVGDAAALRSAVQNLIANAVKYGGRDRWVGLRADVSRDRGRAEVRITVSDHGPGIPAADLPHIFEPFYRGSQALGRQIHGSGLGLSLVKRIVTAHGGRVTVSTRAGVGSSFTIALPAAEADVQATPIARELRATAHS